MALLAGLLVASPPALAGAQIVHPLNPSVSDDAIYVSSQGVVRFDRGTLERVWRALPGIHTFEPVVTPQAVLVGSTQGLYALAPDSGATRWHLPSAEALFSPTVSAATAYVGGQDGSLRAVAIGTGEVLWERRLHGWIYPPAVVDGVVVAGGSGAILHGIEARSGRTRWTRELAQELVYRPVAAGRGRVIVTTFAPEVALVDVAGGRVVWRRADPTPSFPPAVAGDRLYAGAFDGTLKARRLRDGRVLWERPLHQKLPFPPRVSARAVLVASDAGRVALVEPDTGRLLWERQEATELVASPIALGDGIALFLPGADLAVRSGALIPGRSHSTKTEALK